MWDVYEENNVELEDYVLHKEVKCFVKLFFFAFLLAITILATTGLTLPSNAKATTTEQEDVEREPSVKDSQISIQAYKLEDNTGYRTSSDQKVSNTSHPLRNNLINLQLFNRAELTEATIETGTILGYNGYGVTGNYASIQLSYNFDNVADIYASGRHYSISRDTYQSVGEFYDIGVVGMGAMLIQKKTDANGRWEWQDRDGISHNQLHTFDFTDTVAPSDYSSNGEKYTLYTFSGTDLSSGIFIKISFAYEIKYTTTIGSSNLWGVWKTETTTHYINMLEEAEFYVVQNSGELLFHNASSFGQVGNDDESGAISLDRFETLLSGDVTLNGFRLDTMGIEAYTITYRKNGEYPLVGHDGQFFLAPGRYDFNVERKFGVARMYTIFVDRREPNDAAIGYFGQGLFTESSKRVYTTGEYPAYLAGTNAWNLNPTDGTVVPLVGVLYKIVDIDEIPVCEIAQPYNTSDYKTTRLQGTIYESGLYKAEFWGNPKYLQDTEISGDLYHFVFRFEILSEKTSVKPSINEAYLNGFIGFSDMQSRYYSVGLQTAGTGKAIFAFSDYASAYSFAYNIELSKVININGDFEYNEKQYLSHVSVLTSVDSVAQSRVSVRYFDGTSPASYQTAELSNESILSLNFNQDIIVFLNDTEQEYLKAGLPSLNGRKYRYVTPDTGEIEEGVMHFAFVKVADFESRRITLMLKETSISYEILYGVSVEHQLEMMNAASGIYIVREENIFGDYSEYEAVYIKPYDMTGSLTVSLYYNGHYTQKTFSKINTTTEVVNGFIFRFATNELDPYSIAKITQNGQTEIYSFDEVKDIWFIEAGTYSIALIDRHGGKVEFMITITNPIGYADIYFGLDFEDDSIPKYVRAFVGETIELPIPTLTTELFVFDGWVYNDAIISDTTFTPSIGGVLHMWQQVTQQYTYLLFDSNGGSDIQSEMVEIGIPYNLPLPSKQGWTFGGWEYNGRVYSGVYTPTSASPLFVAVWNYEETSLMLYDGDLYDVITAHANDKVVLPFPTRMGYTFFGWYEEVSNNSAKVYYGQITCLANIAEFRLDALWIRNSSVTIESLDNGTNGRTMVHFVDGDLLVGDNVQGLAGATVTTPNVTRAGFTFVGWIWRTTSISGKLYTEQKLTIPSDAGSKIVVESLWIARSIGVPSGVEGMLSLSLGESDATSECIVISSSISDDILVASIVTLTLTIIVFGLRRRKTNRLPKIYRDTSAPIEHSSYYSGSFETKINKRQFNVKVSLSTMMVTLLLVLAIFTLGAFGDWSRFGVFEKLRDAELERQTLDEAIEESTDNTIFDFTLEHNEKELTEEVIENFAILASTISQSTGVGLQLSDRESFLTAVIMLDLYDLGYDVFPTRIRTKSVEIWGLGYTDYMETFEYECAQNSSSIYFGAGFVSLPNQPILSSSDIKEGLFLDDFSNEVNADETPEYGFLLSFTESYGSIAYVVDGELVIYDIEETHINFEVYTPNESTIISQYASCKAQGKEFDTVYSYDDGRNIFDSNIGDAYNVSATSLNTLLDPVFAKSEYERYVAEQTTNGFTVDTLNYVYISYAALESYLLSQQDESLLGIDVQEFYEMERSIGANEYYTVDASGNLTKLSFPLEKEDKATWMDRLAGAALAIGTMCVGVIIVAAISVFSCGAATAAAPYIVSSFIGAGMEIFMQTVVQGIKIQDLNWLRVGIAAVSGALAAIPGIGWFGAGMLQGTTQASLTLADGGDLKEALISFGIGFATGVVIHGLGQAISKMRFCFVSGTAVLMSGGYTKAIENVRIGDMVKSYNERTGKIEEKRVLNVSVSKASELTKVHTSEGIEVVATSTHKFFANNDWVSAENLRAGDILVNVNGQKVVVEAIQHEILETPVNVYNFEVADNHTYFVGDSAGIAVHNAPCSTDKLATKGKSEMHHIASNKSLKTGYTERYKTIFDNAGIKFNDPDNIIELPNHSGRHTNRYKDIVLDALEKGTADKQPHTIEYTQSVRDVLKDLANRLLKDPRLPYSK
jgi:hypothetical protein